MNIYKLKIKEKFIQSIKDGRKTHEYRLGTSERRKIKIGDILILINNQNKNDYIKVIVDNIEIKNDWNEALTGFWKEDFPGFSTIEEVEKECYKFYKREDVDNYGIVVFKVSRLKKDVKKASVLLDTNIVIQRESSNNVSYEIIQLYKLMDSLGITKYLHEDIKNELNNYKDETVKNIMLAKIEAYNILKSLEINDKSFMDVMSKYHSDINSQIDNKFLYQIFKGKVDFFITNDKELLLKAKDLYLDDVVLNANDFLKLIEKNYPKLIDYPVLSIKLVKIGSIDVYDSFFDSLREDYGGNKFNSWFNKKANEDAYVLINKQGLQGFLYLKIENEEERYDDIVPKFKPAKRLKVGTFKVNSTGLRVGERFIKIIIDYAKRSNVDEIYVTLFEEKRNEVKRLKETLMLWGFTKWGHKQSNNEIVLVKKMNGYYDNTEDPKFNYPFIKEKIKYGLLPIEPQWHTELFPDLFLKNENMSLFEERACSYAIEKIYVCKRIADGLSVGDVMVIYRIGNRYPAKYYSVATGYCVIQEICKPKTFEEFCKVCSNKTVFNNNQLKELYFDQQRKMVIKLLYINSLEKKVIYGDMLHYNIISYEDGPRLTTLLSKEQFDKLLEIGKKEK